MQQRLQKLLETVLVHLLEESHPAHQSHPTCQIHKTWLQQLGAKFTLPLANHPTLPPPSPRHGAHHLCTRFVDPATVVACLMARQSRSIGRGEGGGAVVCHWVGQRRGWCKEGRRGWGRERGGGDGGSATVRRETPTGEEEPTRLTFEEEEDEASAHGHAGAEEEVWRERQRTVRRWSWRRWRHRRWWQRPSCD
jgi:hypothetical protein